MGRPKKPLRDTTRLTGEPLSETLMPSSVFGASTSPVPKGANAKADGKGQVEGWLTSPDLTEPNLPYAVEDIRDTALFLLENPGFSSSVVFRADVLVDIQHENADGIRNGSDGLTTKSGSESLENEKTHPSPFPARTIPGFSLHRTLVRRLIPRNAQLDRPLEQTCHVYFPKESQSKLKSGISRFMVVYTPHVKREEDLPYYHPQLRALGLLYEYRTDAVGRLPPEPAPAPKAGKGKGTMSIHILPFTNKTPTIQISSRLQRTLSNLVEVQIRITKGRLGTTTSKPSTSSPYFPIKDNVIPRARVQDTYSRLKAKYAKDLSNRWVEATEPAKHVFEDLGVAAFLIELWRDIYDVIPFDESKAAAAAAGHFPGFVDIACGNGVLVYILLSEGYPGWGFDARRRKTWGIFPESIQEWLKEDIFIPAPFADALAVSNPNSNSNSENWHGGLGNALQERLEKDTFIISNHADELTLWTPLLAASLNPERPNPFLAIPCCSHSLSGARYRYPARLFTPKTNTTTTTTTSPLEPLEEDDKDSKENDKKGDLRALRAQKLSSQNPNSSSFNTSSTYGALTEELISITTELGLHVVKTLLRIPSTRNIGVLGNCSPQTAPAPGLDGDENGREQESEEALTKVAQIVERECARDGGIYVAAKHWVERARSLQTKGGSGGGGYEHV
ncbi:hypothetical protein BDV06DRAFT_233052 [Aspergillus oleicola]